MTDTARRDRKLAIPEALKRQFGLVLLRVELSAARLYVVG